MSQTDVPGSPLEEVEFLARSPNRVTVLQRLSEGPIGRYELEGATGVSRATLGRILEDFEDRRWVAETDRSYETTSLGAYVASVFDDLLRRFDPVPALNEVAQWFPEEGFGFDLGRLAGSEVVRPTRTDALAPTNHIARRLRSADRVRLVTYAVLPDVMQVCWRGTVEDGLALEGVLDRVAVEHLATDRQSIERALEMIATDRCEIVVYGGDVPVTVFVVDDAVLLCLSGGDGAPRAVIETDDATVRSWADATIDAYRRKGEVLDPALFTT